MADRNGRLPASALSPIPGGRLAKGAPARSWLAMRWCVYKRTGTWLYPTGPASSYRSLVKQQEFWSNYMNGKGPLAARPGTSNHGWGKAVDVPLPAQQAAVRKYGHLFGWGIKGGQLSSDAPSEAWHCTYRGPYTRSARVWYWRYRLARKKNK
jgi:zinc D-Ala-D-Ala carboxypeptidase